MLRNNSKNMTSWSYLGWVYHLQRAYTAIAPGDCRRKALHSSAPQELHGHVQHRQRQNSGADVLEELVPEEVFGLQNRSFLFLSFSILLEGLDRSSYHLRCSHFLRETRVACNTLEIPSPLGFITHAQARAQLQGLWRSWIPAYLRRFARRTAYAASSQAPPLIFSASGRMGPSFYKRLADLLSEKWDVPYSKAICIIRCRLSFALLRSAIRCMRGSRSTAGRPAYYNHPDHSEVVLSETALTY